MKIIILLGIHGAGKGEQMKLLIDKGYVEDYIGTGEAFRNIHNTASRYFKYEGLVKPYEHLLSEGKYIPDDVTIGIVKQELETDQRRGFKAIGMEGFPRTLNQAKALLQIVKEIGDLQLQFIYLDLSDDIALKRLAERASYEKRSTDAVDQKRIVLYHEVTGPMIRYLRDQSLVKDVDDLPPVEEVHKSIIELIRR